MVVVLGSVQGELAGVCGGTWILWCFCQCRMTLLSSMCFSALATMVDDGCLTYAPLFIQVHGCLGD